MLEFYWLRHGFGPGCCRDERNWLVAIVATKNTTDTISHHSAVIPLRPMAFEAIPATIPRMPQMPPIMLRTQASNFIYFYPLAPAFYLALQLPTDTV